MVFGNCSICLKKYTSTVSLQDIDKNNIKWFTKLQYIIPELEWFGKYAICGYCTEQLEKAWEFKRTVVSLEEQRQNERTKYLTCSEVGDNSNRDNYGDVDYFDKVKVESIKLDKINSCVRNDVHLFTCYNCSVSFNLKDELIFHLESDHAEGNAILNDTIEKHLDSDYENELINSKETYSALENKFSDFEECIQHLEDGSAEHTNADKIKREKCDEKCNVDFLSVEEFEEHKQFQVTDHALCKKRRGRKPLRKFTCEICGEEFAYVKLVIDHCVSIHAINGKVVKPYACDKCDMRFVSSGNLEQHRNYHDKTRSHMCSLCGKGFMTGSDLTVHQYTHYNRRNYKCTLCDKAFNTNKNLRTHNLVVHTDRNLWKYSCSVCEKRFPLKTNYEQHIRRHTGEKEFSCHICKKPFVSSSELKRHIHVHSNIRAFKCTNCDREYKQRRTYLAHLAKKHGIGDAKISVREKKFVCHICPSQFYDKQKLMRHLCSHSGLKPFPCYACDKKFTDKSYLKHHLKVFHNVVQSSSIDGVS